MFVSIEGIDSTGKSDVCRLLSRKLSPDYPVTVVSDPPDFAPWDHLRDTLLGDKRIGESARAMIFLAARLDAYIKIIKPELRNQKRIILSDRFIDSWFAYQSVKNRSLFKTAKAAIGFFETINSTCVRNGLLTMPDKTFLIVGNVAEAVRRSAGKKTTVYDSTPTQRNVHKTYLRLAAASKGRIKIVNSRGRTIDQVGGIIEAQIRSLMRN
jgi:dTMP kinase